MPRAAVEGGGSGGGCGRDRGRGHGSGGGGGGARARREATAVRCPGEAAGTGSRVGTGTMGAEVAAQLGAPHGGDL
jgi:hypothetical protein